MAMLCEDVEDGSVREKSDPNKWMAQIYQWASTRISS